MLCPICKKTELDASRDYRWVCGWERINRPSGGGTNAIRAPDRSSPDRACRWCVDKLAQGVSPAQERLI
jgi:hypothetical protein